MDLVYMCMYTIHHCTHYFLIVIDEGASKGDGDPLYAILSDDSFSSTHVP